MKLNKKIIIEGLENYLQVNKLSDNEKKYIIKLIDIIKKTKTKKINLNLLSLNNNIRNTILYYLS